MQAYNVLISDHPKHRPLTFSFLFLPLLLHQLPKTETFKFLVIYSCAITYKRIYNLRTTNKRKRDISFFRLT